MQKFDAIIVLGAGVNVDGSLPPSPEASLKLAVKLIKDGLSDYLILSGGKSYKTKSRIFSEAKAMAKLAVKQGLENDQIFIEENSRNTLENSLFTKIEVAMPNKFQKLLVLYGSSHSLERVSYIFNKVYGRHYILEYRCHTTKRFMKSHNQQSLKITKRWFRYARSGDHRTILQIYKLLKLRYKKLV